jgi:hypothetical protein
MMSLAATMESKGIEAKLLQIVRTLSPVRAAQLLDFAYFLAYQNTTIWDQQIEHDLEAGHLDTLLAEVDEEYEAGMAKTL